MQLRETKLTPLGNGRTQVELTYSDDPDLERATTLLRYRVPLEPKGKSALAMVQREAVLALHEWAQEETLRLRNESF